GPVTSTRTTRPASVMKLSPAGAERGVTYPQESDTAETGSESWAASRASASVIPNRIGPAPSIPTDQFEACAAGGSEVCPAPSATSGRPPEFSLQAGGPNTIAQTSGAAITALIRPP